MNLNTSENPTFAQHLSNALAEDFRFSNLTHASKLSLNVCTVLTYYKLNIYLAQLRAETEQNGVLAV